MLVKLSSGSANAFRTVHELNICSILKDVLSTGDLSHGTSCAHQGSRHSTQVGLFYAIDFPCIFAEKSY